jgi:hypothetical protein
MLDQMEPENCDPLSEVMNKGTPNQLIHPEKMALEQLTVDVSDNGTTSHHLVILSTIVNRCVHPSLEGARGPTKSTCR